MFTLEYNTVEKTFSDWGIGQPRFQRRNRLSDIFAFNHAGAKVYDDELFPYGGKIIVRRNREIINDTFANGQVWFVGWRLENERIGSPIAQSHEYVFADPSTFFFTRRNYLQLWQQYVQGAGVKTTDFQTHVVLNQDVDGDIITLGEQIRVVVQQLAEQTTVEYGAPQFQAAATYPEILIPVDEVTDLTAAEVIEKMMRWIDGACYWDYSTGTLDNPIPTLQAKMRSELTPVTIPLLSTAALKRKNLRIKSRPDLVPPAVCFIYKSTGTQNGVTVINTFKDIATPLNYITPNGLTPDGFPPTEEMIAEARKFGVPVQTFDFAGLNISGSNVNLTCQDLNADSGNAAFKEGWWRQHVPGLRGSDIKIHSIKNVVYTRSQILPRQLDNCVIPPNLTQFRSEKQQVTAEISYSVKKSGEVGAETIHTWDKINQTVDVIATDATTGSYTAGGSITGAEALPFGLAKRIFDELRILHWEGTIDIVEQEITDPISLGNSLNISGGRTEWNTMAAQVQCVDYDLFKGMTTITFGPPKHICAGDLIERFRTNRNRFIRTTASARTNAVNASQTAEGGLVGSRATTGGSPGNQVQSLLTLLNQSGGKVILDTAACGTATFKLTIGQGCDPSTGAVYRVLELKEVL